MADQKRWFKVWGSITQDPAFLALPLEDLGRWTALGAWIAVHGTGGKIVAPEAAVRTVLRIPESVTVPCSLALPNVRYEEIKNRDGWFIVTMDKWHKYQEDSTAAQRMKTLRSKRRREEKRKEVNKTDPPTAPPKGDDFARFWQAYPKRKNKGQAEKAWTALRPDEQLTNRILAAIEWAKTSASWERDGGRFIPYPATWLRAKGWEDEEDSTEKPMTWRKRDVAADDKFCQRMDEIYSDRVSRVAQDTPPGRRKGGKFERSGPEPS